MSTIANGGPDVLGGISHAAFRRDGRPGADTSAPAQRRDFSDELQGPQERLAVILGTLKAALSLGMVYVVVFGLAIALMLWLWT